MTTAGRDERDGAGSAVPPAVPPATVTPPAVPPAPTESAPSGLAVALRGLAPPEHGDTFWDDLDRRIADEPQLRLAPRAAIRPITQPPPVIDDRRLAEHLAAPGPRPRRSLARLAAWGAAVVVVALVVAAALQDPDGDTEVGPTSTRAPTATSETSTSSTTTTVPRGTIEPTAPLTLGGVGPLTIGRSLRDLQAAGFPVFVDQSTFDGSDGTCYDARVAGSLDLLLRFRSATDDGVSDPADGVLAAVGIDAALPTGRTTDTGIGLGAPQDQVRATYPDGLDERSHPFISGGRILIAPNDGSDLAVAYLTDGTTVNGIAIGARDVVKYVNGCS